MDLTGIAFRVVVTALTLLALVRASGKLTVRNASTFDFVVALIVGDMADDAIWAEVEWLKFLSAAVALFATHWAAKYAGHRL